MNHHQRNKYAEQYNATSQFWDRYMKWLFGDAVFFVCDGEESPQIVLVAHSKARRRLSATVEVDFTRASYLRYKEQGNGPHPSVFWKCSHPYFRIVIDSASLELREVLYKSLPKKECGITYDSSWPSMPWRETLADLRRERDELSIMHRVEEIDCGGH